MVHNLLNENVKIKYTLSFQRFYGVYVPVFNGSTNKEKAREFQKPLKNYKKDTPVVPHFLLEAMKKILQREAK